MEPGLRECTLGDWEGGEYRQRVAERDPVVRQVFERERWEVIPGAETSASLAARVRAAIERLAAAHSGHRLAVFTHGGVIGQALALASGSRPFAFLSAGQRVHLPAGGHRAALDRPRLQRHRAP